eukprot:Sspe_Gene.97377::Locus_70977_Transcript_1_1_Confidence_1.000_Length_1028::g.97377::m.97377
MPASAFPPPDVFTPPVPGREPLRALSPQYGFAPSAFTGESGSEITDQEAFARDRAREVILGYKKLQGYVAQLEQDLKQANDVNVMLREALHEAAVHEKKRDEDKAQELEREREKQSEREMRREMRREERKARSRSRKHKEKRVRKERESEVEVLQQRNRALEMEVDSLTEIGRADKNTIAALERRIRALESELEVVREGRRGDATKIRELTAALEKPKEVVPCHHVQRAVEEEPPRHTLCHLTAIPTPAFAADSPHVLAVLGPVSLGDTICDLLPSRSGAVLLILCSGGRVDAANTSTGVAQVKLHGVSPSTAVVHSEADRE